MSGQFRHLKEDEIELRISTVSEKGVTLLLYKTARTDADLLDEVCGPGNWQNDFCLIDGVLFGGIGIKSGDEWIWKRDAGVESYTEKEKGRASDAFKRAGFKWGIGRELYSSPFIFIPSSKCEITERNGKKVCNDRFEVLEIKYDDNNDICQLSIQNSKTGALVFTWKSGQKPSEPENSTLKSQTGGAPIELCEECHSVILPSKTSEKFKTVQDVVKGTKDAYGKRLCLKCAKEYAAVTA